MPTYCKFKQVDIPEDLIQNCETAQAITIIAKGHKVTYFTKVPDQQTDRPTNQPMDNVTYRAAWAAKMVSCANLRVDCRQILAKVSNQSKLSSVDRLHVCFQHL